jgi:hypothetical protein
MMACPSAFIFCSIFLNSDTASSRPHPGELAVLPAMSGVEAKLQPITTKLKE